VIETSATVVELFKSLHAAQGQIKGVAKDAKNPHFKSRYVTLEAAHEAARPALQATGLSITQAPGKLSDGIIEITTMLAHVSGEWMRSTLHMPVPKRDPQGVGSAITYGLRYSLMAVLGMPPTDDDDGEAAMPSREEKTKLTGAGREPAVTVNGRAIERTASQRAADNLTTELWKIKGDAVNDWLKRPGIRGDLDWIDEADRRRVLDFAKERRNTP
jgi:hypothetical protein